MLHDHNASLTHGSSKYSQLPAGGRQLFRGLRRRYASLMPGWPIILTTLLIIIIIFVTGQGRQAARAVLSDWSSPLIFSFVVIVVHGVITQGAFLVATSHQEDFLGQSLRLHRFQRGMAFIFSLSLPAALISFILWLDGVEGTFSYIMQIIQTNEWSVEAFDRRISPAVLFATIGVGLVIGIVNLLLLRLFYRIRENSFGQIVTIDIQYLRLIRGLTGLGIITGAALQFLPASVTFFGPVSITILAFTLVGVFLNWIVAILRRHQLPPLAFFLIILASGSAALSKLVGSEYHDFKTVTASDATMRVTDPEHISTYARKWLEDRNRVSPDPESDINVIIVLAEGGGIYAARNAAGILTRLDELSCGGLYQDIYVMSGVSGGSVGLASFLAARKHGLISTPSSCQNSGLSLDPADAIHEFLGKDFLSPLVTGLFFRDIPNRFVPVSDVISWFPFTSPPADRAQLFESELARQWKKVCGEKCPSNAFEEDFISVIQAANSENRAVMANDGSIHLQGPVVLFNTTRVDTGSVEVISNVTFDKLESSPDGTPLYNIIDRLPKKKFLPASTREILSLATAAHMSARFPIVSPTAVLTKTVSSDKILGSKEHYRFVDGGYLDNSGAIVALRAVDDLTAAVTKLDADADCDSDSSTERCLGERLKFSVLHIYSRKILPEDSTGPNTQTSDTASAGTNWVEEILNPVLTTIQVQNARSHGAVTALCRSAIAGSDIKFKPFCRKLGQYRKPVISKSVNPPDETVQSDNTGPPLGDCSRIFEVRATEDLDWVNAPIDIGEDPKSKEFVPLGWFLGKASNEYMRCQEKQRAVAVCRSLNRITANHWPCD